MLVDGNAPDVESRSTMQRSPSRASLPKATDRYPLGAAGLRVSPLCLGMITDAHTVRAAYEAGINFFFVSNDLHWLFYEPLMKGLQDLLRSGVRRDDIVVAGVSYLSQPFFAYLQFDELLTAIPALERVDVIVAGGTWDENFLSRQVHLERARDTKKWGCTAIGASFHDRAVAKMGIRSDLLDLAYIRYNPGHPGAERDLFPHLDPARACLTYNFKSTNQYVTEETFRTLNLDDSHWHPHITDHYRFALSRPELDGLLVSPQGSEQVAGLIKALEEGPLTDEESEYMKDLWLLANGRAQLA